MSSTMPDDRGRFGEFGGRFVPETVMGALDELTAGYEAARLDPGFAADIEKLGRDYVGRPSPLYEAERFAEGTGARILLKREDLNHTGAHKINNAVGQALLAERHGQAPHHGRDRRRPARRGDRHRVRAVRHGVRTSTWARRTCERQTPTSFGCGCWGPRWCRVDGRHGGR